MKRFILHVLLFPVLGCGGGAPSPPPPAPPPPEQADAGVISAQDNLRKLRQKASSNTILTSPQGVAGPAPTQTKTLLGA